MCAGKSKIAKSELIVAGATGIVEQTLQLTNVDKIIPITPIQMRR